MAIRTIVGGLHVIPVGSVNAFLLDDDQGLTLIDAGFPGKEGVILDAIRLMGRQPEDVHRILVTHAHPDHIGSLAALRQATGATVWVHPMDRAIVESGTGFRPLTPAPGLLNRVLARIFAGRVHRVEPTPVDATYEDGDVLPAAGGLTVIHAPGHCAGQVAFLWRAHGGVLLAGDACANTMGLGWSIGYEDLDAGRQSLSRLAGLDYEVACFGHGKAILTKASDRMRSRWVR